MNTPTTERCHPDCAGWLLDDASAVVRCDECRRFADDEAAADYVQNTVRPRDAAATGGAS